MTTYRVRLLGPSARGARAGAPLLRDLLGVLVEASQRAVRLHIEGRSSAPGRAPAWLESAATFDLVGLEAGSTQLVLQTQTLETAVPQFFAQADMFAPRDPASTGLSLLAESLEDALHGKLDSDRYDDGLLDAFQGFARVFRHGVDSLEIGGRRRVGLDHDSISALRKLRHQIPAPQRAMVAGKLDAIQHSGRLFTLMLESGEAVRGILGDDIELADVGRLWGEVVRVSGTAQFRPSGAVLRIETDRIEAFVGDASLWSTAPTPLGQSLDIRELHRPQGPRSGVAAIFGQWPGDETDEELMPLLEQLS